MERQTSEEVQKNITRVKASITIARLLALQGVAFRGHDETEESSNRGNFIEFLQLLADHNEEIGRVALDKAPPYAKYISHEIQKQILHVLAKKVRNHIFEEVGNYKYSIIVDEASDESSHEQMAIVLRFVDANGLIQERFFDIVHVENTTSKTLYTAIRSILSFYKFPIQNLRGQGYDGASNMRGEWNGLQALFLKDSPQAYYVHCMAHRLQLSLVAAAKEVYWVHEFFRNLSFIITAVTGSCKRQDQLEAAEAAKIAIQLAAGEIETGKGANQVSTLQRPCDTRWSSHLRSISNLIKLYGSTCKVLENITKDGCSSNAKWDATSALERMKSFDFIFILFLMKEILSTTDILSQALQRKSQDIFNAMILVESTKKLLNEFRDKEWDSLLAKVVGFCKQYDIEVPDLSAPFFRGRSIRKRDVTNEHHYHYDVFNAAIDVQMTELGSRFNDRVVELLKLSSSLNPRDGFKTFDIDAICKLAREYYPLDFSDDDIDTLKFQLKMFQVNIPNYPSLEKLSSIADLCKELASTRLGKEYSLIDRLIRLLLTLPVSTATGERAFSAMKIVKNRLRNKMNDDFLADSLVIFIERMIAKNFRLDDILSDFVDLKERRVLFK
ncbi:unnamed protein product [Linum tenue]|uniref:Zinc finger MYM-type protein 1-like n=1 Tax=Linum tenue TaxID=586396 RepID=A0AAV0LMN7_9ROSI|nr:unnamed protein product [Linum tenue]